MRECKLFEFRQDRLLAELALKLRKAKSKGPGLYEIWMKQESDLVQDLALAYGEKIILQQFINTIDTADESLKPILQKLRALYGLCKIEKHLTWFMTEGLLPLKSGRLVPQEIRELCAELRPHALQLCEGFGIPEHMCFAPIAGDWEGYNTYDNQGELGTKRS